MEITTDCIAIQEVCTGVCPTQTTTSSLQTNTSLCTECWSTQPHRQQIQWPHTHTPTAQVHKRPWVRWRRWEYREYNYILTATWYKHYTPPLFQLVLHIDHWTSQRTVSWCEYCAAKLGAESRELTDDSYVRVYGIIYVCLSICGIHTHTHWLHVCTGIWGLLINTPSDILCMLNECRKSLVYCTYM